MGKVYLSFLGTNDYIPCIYFKDETYRSSVIRFVQEATVELCCHDWTEKDRIVVFTTRDAFEKNWLDHGHFKDGKPLERIGLKRGIDQRTKAAVQQIPIPEGKSEAEIWEIFSIVFDTLHKGDRVIFDITHAFRSIPMLAVVILNYAKIMKGVQLDGIYYGAFEVLGNPRQAEKIPPEERLVPLLDLTAFDQLLDWSFAIDRFIKAGDARLIDQLARGGLSQILTETKGQDKNAAAIRNIGKTLSEYCRAIATCRFTEIGGIAAKLRARIEECENANLLPPFRPLFGLIETEFSPFTGEMVKDGFAAAQWCLNHNLIQQGVTILRELFLTHVVSSVERDWNDTVEREEIASAALGISFNRKYNNRDNRPTGKHAEAIAFYMRWCEDRPDLLKLWGPLSDTRNDLNHGGFRSQPKKADFFARELSKTIEKLRDLLVTP